MEGNKLQITSDKTIGDTSQENPGSTVTSGAGKVFGHSVSHVDTDKENECLQEELLRNNQELGKLEGNFSILEQDLQTKEKTIAEKDAEIQTLKEKTDSDIQGLN